jgi:cation:H+ antiporter
MFSFGSLSSLPIALGLFLVSLIIVVATSARFTRKLEELCETFNLSIGMLSLVSALGANIPNYVSSLLAISGGHDDVGIGIIIGSNIYNIAIILGLCTFFTTERAGMTLDTQEKRDVSVIAYYAFVITLVSGAVILVLPGEPLVRTFHASKISNIALPLMSVLALSAFGALLTHTFRRSHARAGTTLHKHHHPGHRTPLSILRLGSEVFFTLAIALGGVLVMVQAGQAFAADLHLPSVLAGLLILAVATSLPNTVVAVSLVRTGEAAACIEEICSSGSINIVLGIVLPLLFWQGILQDRFLLLLDTPLLLVLAAGVLFCVWKGRISRGMGALLLGAYVVWVLIRFWV